MRNPSARRGSTRICSRPNSCCSRSPSRAATDFIGAVTEATGARVLVCTSEPSDDAVLAALQAGAVGFLRKDTLTPEALAAAVQAAAGGDGRARARPARQPRARRERRRRNGRPALARLTEREQQVLALIAQGHPDARGRAGALLFGADRQERPARRGDQAQRPQPLAGRRARGARRPDLTRRLSVAMTSVVPLLEGKRIVICAGSGGVGKTTTSAALAMGMADARDEGRGGHDRPGQAAGERARDGASWATSRTSSTRRASAPRHRDARASCGR